MKVAVKFGVSRSNHSRDIQLPHFVTNSHDDNDAGGRRSSHKLDENTDNLTESIHEELVGTASEVGGRLDKAREKNRPWMTTDIVDLCVELQEKKAL